MSSAPSRSSSTPPIPARRPAVRWHNLGTVVGFEFFRTTKKPRFWIATLAIPVVTAIVFALIFVSNSSTSASADAQKNATLSFTYTDASGIIPEATGRAAGGTKAANPEQAVADVKAGTVDAYFAYPADPAAEPVRVYGADRGFSPTGPTRRWPSNCSCSRRRQTLALRN